MKYAVQNGPVTNQIFIGRLNKAQTMFLDDKEDQTNLAINAVREHVLRKYGGSMTFTVGKEAFSIVVEPLVGDASGKDSP